MAIISSAASGNASSTSTWVGGVVPGAGDDVRILGHVVTLDIDVTWNSLEFLTSSAGRLNPSGTTRNMTITTRLNRGVNSSATTITVPSGCTFNVVVGNQGIDATTNQSQRLFNVLSGGTLNLTGPNGDGSDELLDYVSHATDSLFTMTQAGTINVTGRLHLNGGNYNYIVGTATAGNITITHTGVIDLGVSTSMQLLSITGSGVCNVTINGDVQAGQARTSVGTITISNNNCTCTLNGSWYQYLTNNGGALLYVSGGILTLNGKTSHLGGTNTLTVLVAGTAAYFRWQNQTHTILDTEGFTLVASAGQIQLNNLTLNNYGRTVGVLYGSSGYSSNNFTLYNYAGAVGGFNFLDIIRVTTPDPAPTLPAVGNVSAGTSYGYAASPLTGTGLVVDPATIAAAVGDALTTYDAATGGDVDAAETAILDALDNITVDNAAIATAVWTNPTRTLTDYQIGAIQSGLATSIELDAAEAAILAAIGSITVDNAAIATAVWVNPTRTLTDYQIGAIQSGLATSVELDAAETAILAAIGSITVDNAAIATAVWVNPTRTLTDKAGFTLANNAITAAVITSDAVAEIQAGLATSVQAAAIEADTQNIQSRLPAELVGGRMNSFLDAEASADVSSEISYQITIGGGDWVAAVAIIAGAVYEEDYADHTTPGTYGFLWNKWRKSNPTIDGEVRGAIAPTTTTFATDVNYPTGALHDMVLFFLDGSTVAGQNSVIVSYDNTNGLIEVEEPFSHPPEVDDQFIIIPTSHVHSLRGIQEAVLGGITSTADYPQGAVGFILRQLYAMIEAAGLGWRYTAESLSQSPSSLTVLPASGSTPDRGDSMLIKVFTDEQITQTIAVYEADGTTPVDLSAKTLQIVFERYEGDDVVVIGPQDITITGDDSNIIEFDYPAVLTATPGTRFWALRDALAPFAVYISGQLQILRAPIED